MEITDEELKNKIAAAVTEATKGLFTQEQVNKVVSERVNAEKTKHQKDLEEREKVAKMNAEEKQKHDFDVLTAERDSLKQTLAAREHKDKILQLMSDKKIDSSFYDVFSSLAEDKAGAVMDKFNETIQKQVSEGVDNKLGSNVPNKTQTPTTEDAQLRAAMGLK